MGEERGYGRDGREDPASEEALERTLVALGPLLRRRREVSAPDPAFVHTLRGRLLATESTTPDPLFVPTSRAGRVRERWGRTRQPRLQVRRVAVGVALAAAVLVALVAAAVALVWLDLAVAVLVAVVLVAVLVGRRW